MHVVEGIRLAFPDQPIKGVEVDVGAEALAEQVARTQVDGDLELVDIPSGIDRRQGHFHSD